MVLREPKTKEYFVPSPFATKGTLFSKELISSNLLEYLMFPVAIESHRSLFYDKCWSLTQIQNLPYSRKELFAPLKPPLNSSLLCKRNYLIPKSCIVKFLKHEISKETKSLHAKRTKRFKESGEKKFQPELRRVTREHIRNIMGV